MFGVRDGGEIPAAIAGSFHDFVVCRGNDLEKGIWPGVRARQLDLHPSLNPAGDMALVR